MSDSGRLTIETFNTNLDDAYAALHPDVVAGQYVMVAVSDNGSGMSADVFALVFDPFFTTKGVGKGTGLGLSQVHGFGKQSGGHIIIYSEPGQGTTVKMYLPRFFGVEESTTKPAPISVMPTGNAKQVILVVEDEERVRQLTIEMLRELGYTVLEADSAASALQQLNASSEVNLLFTDIVMPDVNGRQLADEAQRNDLALKVLFTSGYRFCSVFGDTARKITCVLERQGRLWRVQCTFANSRATVPAYRSSSGDLARDKTANVGERAPIYDSYPAMAAGTRKRRPQCISDNLR